MTRIPFNHNFSLRFIFLDLDNFPVSIRETDVDIMLSTRSTMPAVKAFVHEDASHGAVLLDDGSIIVPVDAKRLLPGKLKAIVNVHAALDNNRDMHGHHPDQRELFVFNPEVPVELIEPHSPALPHLNHHKDLEKFNPDKPVTIVCRFNLRNPQLVKHVTRGEMKQAISEALSGDSYMPADQEDIDNIIAKFKVSNAIAEP